MMDSYMRFILVLVCTAVVLACPYAQAKDAGNFVIGAKAVRDFGEMSAENVEIVENRDAWNGLAIYISDGAAGAPPPSANPQAWFSIGFTCEAGDYYVWLHGMSEGDTQTDSVWLQFDDEIGTTRHRSAGSGMGNWRDNLPAGAWDWAASFQTAWSFTFETGGPHTMLVQPRQVPHYIDQFWFSVDQDVRPDGSDPVDGFDEPVLSVSPQGMLAIAWGDLKTSR